MPLRTVASVTLEIVLRLVAGALLVAANAFFVAVEFALTRLPQLELSDEDLEGHPGLKKARDMTERLEIHLTGCQLGISTSSVLLGVVAEPALTEMIRPLAEVVGLEGVALRTTSVVAAVVLLNLVHKIWGEQAPTYLGVERPRAVVERLAPVLWWWTRLMGPVIRLGDGLAKASLGLFGVEITRSWAEESEGAGGEQAPIRGRSELKRRMGELLARGEVAEDRREEVIRALEIGDMPAREIMVPVDELTLLPCGEPTARSLERIGRAGHVRYPVVSGEDAPSRGPTRRSQVRGLLYLPALFREPERLRGDTLELDDVVEQPPFLSADTRVSEVIDRLQAARHEAALLTEDDRLVGMVTITDALEAIAGDVEDPLD